MTTTPDRHIDALRADKHIIMLVANGVTGDSRVQKSATSAAAAGYRVTVVGVSKGASRSVESLGDVTVVRLPVAFASYNAAKRKAVIEAKGRAASVARTVRTAHRVKGAIKPSMRARRSRVTRIQVRLGRIKDAGAGWRQKTSLRARIAVSEALLRLERLGVRGAEQALAWAERRTAAPSQLDSRTEERLFRSKLDDLEAAFLAELSMTRFDLVHAHDFTMIECAAKAVEDATTPAGRPRLVYDAHEWVRGLTHLPRGTQTVSARVEAENIRAADAVVTVSPVLAERLQVENSLRERPGLVLNAPVAGAFDPGSGLSVRERAGLGGALPLAVYGGAVKASRGVGTIIRALGLLDELHLAIVASDPSTAGVKDVLSQADEAGVRDRVHVVPYVEPHQVSTYLRTADVGIHPLLRSGNAELALPNKIFEYMHAGLPMVVSDMPSMAGVVREHGWGEVFAVDDHEALAAALGRVLAAPRAYEEGLCDPRLREKFSWERQAQTLIGVYDRLLFGEVGGAASPAPAVRDAPRVAP